MSVYSSGLASILKQYSATEREKAKNAIINKVRFEMPQQRGLLEAVKGVEERENYHQMNDFVSFLQDTELSDMEFFRIVSDARKVVSDLSPKYTNLVEALIALPWTKRTEEAQQMYTDFAADIMVAHSKYIPFCITKMISQWIPADVESERWPNGTPDEAKLSELAKVHKLLDRVMNAIPMAFDVVLDTIEKKFPYYKKPSHVVAGYTHNILWLIEYKPIFTQFALQLILRKMVILDVNAPRHEIEESEEDEEDNDEDDGEDIDAQMFEMDDCKNDKKVISPMNHPIAYTLDMCLEKLYAYIDSKRPVNGLNSTEEEKLQRHRELVKFFKSLMAIFDDVILPSHNTHHVQFVLFYLCSFRATLAESFLNSLMQKIKNPNVSGVIRQAAVGYMASFLARSKNISIITLKQYLKELCDWAHQYIERCDQYRTNGSLKANIVFFTTCQAIFYVIAFRSRDLTSDKKNLLFLQSLQLSGLVTCNFNPLRVCLPAVATAFAGVTRAHQLAYCHAILERNARRKLATVYANETATAEEVLDTFFPFDPYLLKLSAGRISPCYLQYQASEAEEQTASHTASVTSHGSATRRKRGDSEMLTDDVDDFLISDKRRKLIELAKSQEREAQFTYGLSPGFHT